MNTRTVIKAMVAFFILVAIIYRINEQQVVNRDQYAENHKRSQEIVELHSQVKAMELKTTNAMNELDSVIQSMKEQQTKAENHITELENNNAKLKREVERLGKQAQQVSTVKSSNKEEASDWVSFEASAYTAKCKGCTGITSTGKNIRNQSVDHKVIAVDPNVIPLGSLVEVQGYGTFTALDTGGAIKGHKVDILHQTYKSATDFGRRTVKIRIIK